MMMTVMRSFAITLLVVGILVSPCAGQTPLAVGYRGTVNAERVMKVFEATVLPVMENVYIYATIHMGPSNPIKYLKGVPQWGSAGVEETGVQPAHSKAFKLLHRKPAGPAEFLQTLAVGQKLAGKFSPMVRFGLGNDGRRHDGADVCAWVADGKIDYYAPFLRPQTPYDFKLRLDLKRRRMSAWVSGRGDDKWFMLADNVALQGAVPQVNCVRVELYPNAPRVTGLIVRSKPLASVELVRKHPRAKQRVVGPNRGFRFQSMRSTWRQAGKHVTVFREPNVHAAFPDVAQAGPNRLVAVWRDGSHSGGVGGLSFVTSDDLGKTWGKPVKLSRMRANCPRIQRLNDGSLLILCDTNGQRTVDFWRSTDGGRKWVKRDTFNPRKAGGAKECYVPSRLLELSDKSWILSSSSYAWVPGLHKGIRGDTERLDFYRSTDSGRTWKFLSGPLFSPPYTLSEPSTLEFAPGKLVTYARDSNGARPGATAVSTDNGKTWKFRDLPYPIVGRTCAGFLQDGRVMNTFRAAVGKGSLWAWIGDVKDTTGPQPVGAHFNDRRSVGLKGNALHIDNDGRRGQFTRYYLPPPETDQSTLDLTFEVKVLANNGKAASVVIPFAGVLRLFPDHVLMSHNRKLRATVTPGKFHTYRIRTRRGRMTLFIDGKKAWDTDKGDSRVKKISHWLPIMIPSYVLSFGNETADSTNWLYVKPTDFVPEVSGYSVWRSVKVITDDPKVGKRVTSWTAKSGFPDQFQLDNIVEIEASANGYEQGYSGWIQLKDGRIFVVHYTDDSAPVIKGRGGEYGIPWIRGTFLQLSDLPPKK